MQTIKKISILLTLLLLPITGTNYTMEPTEKPKKSFGEKILSPIKSLWQKDGNTTVNSPLFSNVPKNKQSQIEYLLKLNPQSFEAATESINSLAQENQEVNQLLNDAQFCLELIKKLAQKFKCSDQEIAERLQSIEAKRRFKIQDQLYQFCTFSANLSVLDSLLKQGVDLEFTYKYYNSDYRTPLMLASMIKGPMLKELCKYTSKFDINRRDKEGETALMLAAQEGLAANVKTLLDAGANPKITDNKGLSPLKAAQESESQETIDLIQNATK